MSQVVFQWCPGGAVRSGGVPVVFPQWCPGGVAVVSWSYPNPVPLVSSMLVPGLWGGWCPVGEVVGGVMVVGGVVGCWSSGGGCGVVGVVELFGVVCLFGDVYSVFCVVVIGVSVVASAPKKLAETRLLSCHDDLCLQNCLIVCDSIACSPIATVSRWCRSGVSWCVQWCPGGWCPWCLGGVPVLFQGCPGRVPVVSPCSLGPGGVPPSGVPVAPFRKICDCGAVGVLLVRWLVGLQWGGAGR